MSEKRFVLWRSEDRDGYTDEWAVDDKLTGKRIDEDEVVDLLNEQQEWIEELQASEEMGWKRAERFEKKCPKELHNKKMYIKRLEYKVQKFKEENEQLRRENKKKDIEIQSLNAHITNWLNETKIAKLYENEQYRTETLEKENEQLRKQLKEKEEDEKEYAREILRLNKLVKEYSEIRQLGGDY